MINKYAEGYPGARYYGGCEHVDEVERLAVQRVKKLFKAEYANVQTHSGSQANMAVYMSFMKPGDTILGMNLTHGGHLTHGSPASFSGKIFQSISYNVKPDTQRIDYDQVYHLAKKHKPKMIIAGASAYPRFIDYSRFKQIAQETGALVMVDMAHISGLVAVGLHPSPVNVADFVTSTTHKTLRGPRGGFILSQEKHAAALDRSVFPGIQGGPMMHIIASKAVAFGEAFLPEFLEYQKQVVLNAKVMAETLLSDGYKLVSGGTDNHLVLIDLTESGMSGAEAENFLGQAGIAANKNSIPYDTKGPKTTSGLRLGTPAMTTRGMREHEAKTVCKLIHKVLQNPYDDKTLHDVKANVEDLCRSFPIYPYADTEE
jgi:glycine hydroxymethyltransferase